MEKALVKRNMFDIQKLPEVIIPFNGVKDYIVQGEKEQVVFMEFERDIDVPEH